MIEWIDDYSLGVPAIDADHRDLVALCNRFLAAARAAEPVHRLAEIMQALIDRAREHFRAEESLLDRHGYPDLALHRSDHIRLLAQAESLMASFGDTAHEEEMAKLSLQTAGFLREWLLDHILRMDKPCRPFLMRLV